MKDYYETVKEPLHTKNNNIQNILKNAEDMPETDLAKAGDLNDIPQEVKEAFGNTSVKSKLYPLKNEDCFVLDIEEQRGKERLSYFDLGPVLHTELFSDDIYLVSMKDSVENIKGLDFFKTNVDRYLNRKYLVLLDCQYYAYPRQLNASEFQPGHLIKKVSIYDIENRKLADSYYLHAGSSEKIRYKADQPANFSNNMADNMTGLLTGSIFQ